MSKTLELKPVKVPLILRLTSGKLNHYIVGIIVLSVLALIWRLILFLEGWHSFTSSINLIIFFSVTISYTIVITRIILIGHLKDFDQICKLTTYTDQEKEQLKGKLYNPGSLGKLTAIATVVGLTHSAIGMGPFYNLITFSSKFLHFDIWMTILIALIWMTITQACAVFVRNLKLFANISNHININLLNIENLTVFLKTGVRSTLAFIGTYALFPLIGFSKFEEMFLNPAIFIFIPLILAMILIPLIPIRKKIKAAKELELLIINSAIEGNKDALKKSQISHDLKDINIVDLLAYKKIILSIREIPFNVPIAFRFLFYIVIPLLTWIAASLVDKIVVAFLKF